MPLPPFASTALAWLGEKLRQVLIWLGCVILFALLPICAGYISARMSNDPVTLSKLLDKGELFLISAAVGGDALGRLVLRLIPSLFPKPPLKPYVPPGLWELFLLMACLFIVIGSTVCYSIWMEKIAKGINQANIDFMVYESLIFFRAVLVVGFGVILTVEG